MQETVLNRSASASKKGTSHKEVTSLIVGGRTESIDHARNWYGTGSALQPTRYTRQRGLLTRRKTEDGNTTERQGGKKAHAGRYFVTC